MGGEPLNLVLALLPELVLLAGGCVLVVALARGPGRCEPSRAAARIALGVVALAVIVLQFGPPVAADQLGQSPPVRLDDVSRAGRWAGLLVGFLLIGANYSLPETRPGRLNDGRGSGEFFMLLLFSLAGMMLTCLANDLVVLFLALELTAMPTFAAVALSRPGRAPAEAAGKYFFLGVLSAGLMMMGLTYLYGLTGQTNLAAVEALAGGATRLWAVLGVGLVLAGLGFKLAAFPFHVCLADVYQGSAGPLAGWLAFVPRAAGFVALARLLGPAGNLVGEPGWTWLVWGLAAATMTCGNVLALWQRNVKRLLAYSSVAHSGYLLVGLLALGGRAGLSPLIVVVFYLVAYGLANLGAFLVLAAARVPAAPRPAAAGDVPTREAETLDDLRGLAGRSRPLAIAMAVFCFSLMGLPPTVGFVAKVWVFLGAYRAGFAWLVVIALVNAAVGAAYYLRVIAACWSGRAGETRLPAAPGPSSEPAGQAVPAGRNTTEPGHAPPGLVIAILAGACVLFGLFPAAIYQRLTADSQRIILLRQPPVSEPPSELPLTMPD